MSGSVIGNISRLFSRSAKSNTFVAALKSVRSDSHPLRSFSSLVSRSSACRHALKASSVLRTPTARCSQAITKGDQELAEFLQEEIEAEKKARKTQQLPKIEGFDVKLDGAEVTTHRGNSTNETVTVHLNVNHSVDAEDADEFSAGQEKAPGTWRDEVQAQLQCGDSRQERQEAVLQLHLRTRVPEPTEQSQDT
uniref:Putative complement component 1 n=1 Tax=Ixodes ricinus TaxID=34613 RepID=A0A090XCY3_IXORI